MGQQITVTNTTTPRPGVVRIDINRSLTGMAHERFVAGVAITGERPPDVLARRIFDRGGVKAVHIYGNVITVELASGADADGLVDLVNDLYIHYREGVTPSFPA
ncbi:MAG: hypothetical protein ACR2H3_02710 [Acidimicrobiales bacterium]